MRIEEAHFYVDAQHNSPERIIHSTIAGVILKILPKHVPKRNQYS